MKIAVIGTEYVGSVTATCLAEVGNEVVCVDKDPSKILALSRGDPVIVEPRLESLLRRNLMRKRIEFRTTIGEAVDRAEIIFMTVGTPSSPNGKADLSFLEAATRKVARVISSPKIIVNKSTVPVGTHRLMSEWIRSETNTPFDLVSNPNFLREGAAVQDFLHPERIVIGTNQAHVFEKMGQLYAPLIQEASSLLIMDPISAELTKYAASAMLATRISFMNELALLCEQVGGDIESIRKGMGSDSRIGAQFLHAGIGYGGSCFPKDMRALLSTAKAAHVPLRIIQAAEDVNELQKKHILHAVWERLGRRLNGRTLAVWGLAFKPDTNDIREAPALVIIRSLLQAGAKIRAYDPVAGAKTRELLGSEITICDDAFSALRGSDGLIIATEWDEFKTADFGRVKSELQRPFLFDGRNILNPERMHQFGFIYHGVGRGMANLPVEGTPADPVSVAEKIKIAAAGHVETP